MTTNRVSCDINNANNDVMLPSSELSLPRRAAGARAVTDADEDVIK